MCCTGKPVSPAAAAQPTTLLEATLKMTSEWDACSQTQPAPIWQRRLKEAAAFACTRGTAWSWPILWCRVKTRPSTPPRMIGRRPASTRHWWGSVWSTGGWWFVWSCSLLVCVSLKSHICRPAMLLRSDDTMSVSLTHRIKVYGKKQPLGADVGLHSPPSSESENGKLDNPNDEWTSTSGQLLPFSRGDSAILLPVVSSPCAKQVSDDFYPPILN